MSRGRIACIAAILAIGGSGVIAQTALLRELLFQFAGSELYIGLIIGNWIAAEALGAFVAGRLRINPAKLFSQYIRLTVLFSLLFPAMLTLARTWRFVAGLPVHEAVGLWQTLSVSILVIFPLAMIHGAQFVLATSIHAAITGRGAESPGKVYGWETVGTVIGGGAASFFLIPLIQPFQIAALLLLVNGAICVSLQRIHQKAGGRPSELVLAITPLLAAGFLFCGGTTALEQGSLRLQWHGDTLVSSRNSPYQNIAVLRSGEQYTFYLDGAPYVSLPALDIAKNEETVHIPLLAHPRPRKVLLLGGGVGGVISEILAHPSLERVDYVELDPLLVSTIENHAAGPSQRELHDPRVNICFKDGRAFLRDTAERYDVVLIGKPLPLNLQGNRYFTAEFFAAARRVMAPGGLIAVGATGSMSYYGDDLRAVNTSLLATIRSVFPFTLVVPGERNLFIASDQSPVDAITAVELSRRLEARELKPLLLSPRHLDWLMHSTPRQWFRQNVGEDGIVNRDFSPYLLTRHLTYMTTQLSPEMLPLLKLFGRLQTVHVAGLILVLTAAVVFIPRGRRRPAVLWTMATSGFAAMLLELSFFFCFQLFQGAMLPTIGLLIAVFMAGLWGGSRVTAEPPVRAGADLKRLFVGDATLLILAGALWMLAVGRLLPVSSSPAATCLVLLPLIFSAGFSAGMQFPPATRLAADGVGPGTSVVYGCDLLGGWLGGVIGGALLLPLLGFADVAVLLLLLKGGSILCLYLQGKRDKMTA